MKISLHPITDKRYDNYLKARLTGSNAINVPTLVIEGGPVLKETEVTTGIKVNLRHSRKAQLGAVGAMALMAIGLSQASLPGRTADASPQRPAPVRQHAPSQVPDVTEGSHYEFQNQTFTFEVPNNREEQQISLEGIARAYKDVENLQNQGWEIMSTDFVGGSTDLYGDADASLGVINDENRFGGYVNANTVSQAFDELSAKSGHPLGSVFKGSIEGVLDANQIGELTRLATSYGYSLQDMANRYSSGSGDLNLDAKTKLDAYFAGQDNVVVVVDARKAIQVPDTKNETLSAKTQVPQASKITKIQNSNSKKSSRSNIPIVAWGLVPFSGAMIGFRFSPKKKVKEIVANKDVELKISDEESVLVARKKTSLFDRIKKRNGDDPVDWSDTLKYKHLLRSGSIKQVHQLTFTNIHGELSTIRVSFIGHKPSNEILDVIENSLQKAVMKTNGAIADNLKLIAIYDDFDHIDRTVYSHVGLGFDVKADIEDVARFTPALGVAEFRIDRFADAPKLTAEDGFRDVFEEMLFGEESLIQPDAKPKQLPVKNIAGRIATRFRETFWKVNPSAVSDLKRQEKDKEFFDAVVDDSFVRPLSEKPKKPLNVVFNRVRDDEFLAQKAQEANGANIKKGRLERLIVSTRLLYTDELPAPAKSHVKETKELQLDPRGLDLMPI